eukprot:TRINITY_DN2089_c0_g1_i1.p2 TRINITY_DN2089_c0_g1~~TRINITY_DN2089_c0_g1_i1.p2  ORF type:complete len:247 (-),score=32.81 TRINITY_DN2089_c0_g1_i1:392-1132(-)
MASRLSTQHSKAYSLGMWRQKMQEVKLDKTTMDQLVMDYLLHEGLYDAAQSFAQETGLTVEGDIQEVQERQNVRRCLRQGDIDAAIQRINDFDPEILDTDQSMYFNLYQQKFLELMREGKLVEALTFTRENLSHIQGNPQFMNEFQKSAEILIYENPKESQAGQNLLSYERVMEVASKTNQSLVGRNGQRKDETVLQLIFKHLVWGQKELAQIGCKFPQITDWNRMELQKELNEKAEMEIDLIQFE